MKAWGLYSARVDPYQSHDLLDVFTDQEVAETVRVNLIGKPVDPHRPRSLDAWPTVWDDDEDFPDLYVRPLEVR